MVQLPKEKLKEDPEGHPSHLHEPLQFTKLHLTNTGIMSIILYGIILTIILYGLYNWYIHCNIYQLYYMVLY